MLKRFFDISVSLIGLVLLSPLFLAATLWVKFGSDGPIFYRGKRVGRNNTEFEMLKFRTMVVNADKLGASSTASDDTRITAAGKFLRRCKLDELPQLLNVLKGEMSFVGPRPQVKWAVDLYSDEEKHLLDMRPGITDWASIKFRDEGAILQGSTDPDADYLRLIAPGKIRLGLLYIQKNNLGVDLKIIFATVLSIFGVDPEWCLPKLEESKLEESKLEELSLEEAKTLSKAA